MFQYRLGRKPAVHTRRTMKSALTMARALDPLGTPPAASNDYVAAVDKAMGRIRPGVPVFPSMASGASDSMWFRSKGVASYGASPTFIKDSDDFSHGLNERTQVSNIAPAITYYLSLFTDLSK